MYLSKYCLADKNIFLLLSNTNNFDDLFKLKKQKDKINYVDSQQINLKMLNGNYIGIPDKYNDPKYKLVFMNHYGKGM
jgi:hypothetical protein